MRIVIVIALLVFGAAAPAASHAAPSAAKKFYCGSVVPVALCKCAFHNEQCEGLGMSRSAADAKLSAGFKAWSCTKQGKVMSHGKCVKPGDEIVKCAVPLYAEKDGACVWRGSRGVSWSAESDDAFRTAVESLPSGEGRVFEGTDVKGNPLRIGILRLHDGSWIFTADGERFTASASEALAPGFVSKFWDTLGGVGTWVARGVGIGKYVGKDTAGDPEKQAAGQRNLDAASAALKNLMATVGDDSEEKFDEAREIIETWTDRLSKVLGDEYEALVVDELGKQTGIDTKTVKRYLDGDDWEKIKDGKIEDVSDDLLDTGLKALFAFPAESVATLHKELKRDRFADAAAAYGQERRAGKAPGEVMAQTMRGELPELEFAGMTGPAAFYAQTAVFTAYEETYQRLLLREKLGGK